MILFRDRSEIEWRSRKAACGHYVGNNIVLCHVLGRYKMYVDGYDRAMTPHIILDGFWESWITQFINRTVQPNWVCVDGGANFGYYTVLLADLVGEDGMVHAFEPGPIFDLLKWNVATNGFDGNTMLYNKALHRQDAEPLFFFHDPHDLGSARPRPAQVMPVEQITDQPVKTVTLDELFLDNPRPPDFVKLDIEGSEEAALEGASELMVKHPHVRWLVEFFRVHFPKPQRFINNIVSAGFELRYIDYDSAIKSTTMTELLDGPRGHWMLWLHKE